MWGEAICTTKPNEPIMLHQTASYLAVDVELGLLKTIKNLKERKCDDLAKSWKCFGYE